MTSVPKYGLGDTVWVLNPRPLPGVHVPNPMGTLRAGPFIIRERYQPTEFPHQTWCYGVEITSGLELNDPATVELYGTQLIVAEAELENVNLGGSCPCQREAFISN